MRLHHIIIYLVCSVTLQYIVVLNCITLWYIIYCYRVESDIVPYIMSCCVMSCYVMLSSAVVNSVLLWSILFYAILFYSSV